MTQPAFPIPPAYTPGQLFTLPPHDDLHDDAAWGDYRVGSVLELVRVVASDYNDEDTPHCVVGWFKLLFGSVPGWWSSKDELFNLLLPLDEAGWEEIAFVPRLLKEEETQ